VTQRALFEELIQTKPNLIVDVLRMDVLEDTHTVYFSIDMELCTMDLASLLEEPNESFNGERNAWRIMSDIANAVQFVHGRGMIIGDLTPNRGNTTYSRWRKYLTSLVLYSPRQQFEAMWKLGDISTVMSRGPSDMFGFLREDEVGTEGYRAPEIINNSHFNRKADIWALGCILYQILSYKLKFETDYHVTVYSDEYPRKVPADIVPLESFVDLESFDWRVRGLILPVVHQMFAVVPDQRPEAKELLDVVFRKFAEAGLGPDVHVERQGKACQ